MLQYCKLIQYLLFLSIILFLISTTIRPCHSHTSITKTCLDAEREALVNFKNTVQILNSSSWVGKDCCTWDGIVCSNTTGNVIELHLSSRLISSLDGNKLSPLLSLTKLEYLDISLSPISYDGMKLIGSFKSLQHLELSNTEYGGRIPDELGNLSALRYLDMGDNFDNYIENTEWLSRLKSLRYLDLNVDMSKASGWLQALNMLPHIVEISLALCELTSLPPLRQVNFTSLELFDISHNNIYSPLPDWLQELKRLRHFDISYNSLNSSLPDWLQELKQLRYLDVSYNSIYSPFPDWLHKLNNLKYFDASQNSLYGSVPLAIGNLSSLQQLHLSNNNLVFETSDTWAPSFQLQELKLDFCQVGPIFPRWLKTQHSLSTLSASNVGIKAHVPYWFQNFTYSLWFLDLSNNDFSGEVSQFFSPKLQYLDLSNNSISGSIPTGLEKRMKSLYYLDLSNNNLIGSIPLSFCNMINLYTLRISSNKLSSELPDCWKRSSSLGSILFSDNHLYGTLPMSLCNLSALTALHVSHNNLSGTLPSCLTNFTLLVSLDLGYNKFTGNIPSWSVIDNEKLVILSLRSNAFTGMLPNISSLSSLQILDLSNNNLSGYIPSSLVKSYAMSNIMEHMNPFNDDLKDTLWIVTKGKEYQYEIDVLSLVILIDLSNNALTGHIPDELVNLHALQTLNLSGNNLIGKIPTKIGDLQQLETLDLSRNKLSGVIPSSLTTLNFLSHLNLSNNNLSGMIPTGHQLQSLDDSSIYENNPNLCGFPLKKLCHVEDHQHVSTDNKNEGFISFYTASAPGFVLGFWVVWGTIILHRKWRIIYFQAIDKVYNILRYRK